MLRPYDRSGGLRARSSSASGSATEIPSKCPGCQSSSISTTAKTPDANSYWRCGRCGEVWNVSRRHDLRGGANRW